MSNLVNMQVYGIPIITYGLIGLTTAVLAYATATSDLGNVVSKTASSMTEVTENPVGAFGKSNEPAVQAEPASSSDSDSDSDSGKTETALEGLNPFANATNDKSGEEPKEELKKEPKEEPKEEEPSGMTGGKKYRKKRSFRRKSNKNKRKRKSIKTKSQK